MLRAADGLWVQVGFAVLNYSFKTVDNATHEDNDDKNSNDEKDLIEVIV